MMSEGQEPEETYIASHRLGEEVSTATDMQATMESLGIMFSLRFIQNSYKE
jgi:hypothetical protein